MAIDVVVARDKSFLANIGITSPTAQLTTLAVLTFMVWGLESITEYFAHVNWRNLAQEIQHALRMDGISHSQKLSLSWFEDRNTGNLQSILSEDVNQVERFLNSGLNDLIQLVVSSLMVSFIFFYISPMVALFAIMPIPIILIGGFAFRKKLAQKYNLVREAAGLLGSRISGVISGVITIRAAGAEDHQIEKVRRQSQLYNETNQRAIRLSSAFVPIIRMGVLSGFLFTLVLGGHQTLEGTMSPAAYTVLVFLTQRLLWPFTRFGEILDLYERSNASIKRVLDLIDSPIEIKDSPQAKDLISPEGEISFHNVSFGYRPDLPIIKNFQLTIKAGQFVAFVGATGAGKSTLTKLILRFYEPCSGQVKLDGVDLTDITQASLRQHLGYVSQDIFLMDGTIRDNLKLQDADISDQNMIKAAQTAEAHNFICELSQGYDTLVGERGQKLSGGQRQRLAIARAIIRNPKILIFDEATSAVDNETEAAIQRSIEHLTRGSEEGKRTLVVIAHRLSTIRNANQIYLMDIGQIAEQGTHEELVSLGGAYSHLWKIQTGGH